MKMFKRLVIETKSSCNRKCPTCVTQTHPTYHRKNLDEEMPSDMVYNILDQAYALGFRGDVCLQFFNEPLMDNRISRFGRYAIEKGFRTIFINTNGDFINEKTAKVLEGSFHALIIALYDKKERKKEIIPLFSKTHLLFTDATHVTTHYSPRKELQDKINRQVSMPCIKECQYRMIMLYTGEMAMCCEDICGEFDLGNVKDTSLEELWFGEKHRTIIETLSNKFGRLKYPYCSICPR